MGLLFLLNSKQEQIALYYHILDIKALEKHKYTRFRVLLATTKFRQKFYRTAIFFIRTCHTLWATDDDRQVYYLHVQRLSRICYREHFR